MGIPTPQCIQSLSYLFVLFCPISADVKQGEDIGRVKIPWWLRQYTGIELEFVHRQGHDFPEDLGPYRLIVHCGSCMLNRREVISRILRSREAGVPITNYGVAITYSLGFLNRALSPFPGILP